MTVLPHLAWMNIEMDACTKQKVLEDNPMDGVCAIPYEGWVCSIKGKRVINHLPWHSKHTSIEPHYSITGQQSNDFGEVR